MENERVYCFWGQTKIEGQRHQIITLWIVQRTKSKEDHSDRIARQHTWPVIGRPIILKDINSHRSVLSSHSSCWDHRMKSDKALIPCIIERRLIPDTIAFSKPNSTKDKHDLQELGEVDSSAQRRDQPVLFEQRYIDEQSTQRRKAKGERMPTNFRLSFALYSSENCEVRSTPMRRSASSPSLRSTENFSSRLPSGDIGGFSISWIFCSSIVVIMAIWGGWEKRSLEGESSSPHQVPTHYNYVPEYPIVHTGFFHLTECH